MADQAQIRSIDDLARFRAQLLNFLSAARVAVEESATDVARQQSWLDLDRHRHWEAELWRRQRKLDEVRQRLFQESIATQRGPASSLQMQVHRAEGAVEEARMKLGRIKAWSRNFENRSLPILKQIEQLQTVLTVDMAHAVNFLNQSLASLDAYASRSPRPPSSRTAVADTTSGTSALEEVSPPEETPSATNPLLGP